MFEFFNDDIDKEYAINPGYWGEKLQAADKDRGHDSNGWEEFSEEKFAANVKNEFDMFAEQYQTDAEEEVEEEHIKQAQEYKQMLAELWKELDEEVITAASDGQHAAYTAAMEFRWKSDNEELEFDMYEFWDYSCKDYTFHYIWILYAIVWGIGEYNKSKE